MWRHCLFPLLLIFLRLPIAACVTPIHVSTKALTTSVRGGASCSTLDELDALIEDAVTNNRKIVVVTGGVLSGIGKGVTASSIGVLFRAMGLRVVSIYLYSACFCFGAHDDAP